MGGKAIGQYRSGSHQLSVWSGARLAALTGGLCAQLAERAAGVLALAVSAWSCTNGLMRARASDCGH